MKNFALKPHKRHWLRVILWVIGVIIFLPVFVVLLFQLAPVQNFARNKVQTFLRNKFHTTVLIGQLRLTWWNSLSLKKVYLGDKDDKALLYSGALNVSFNLLDLINNKLVVKKLDWNDLLVNIYRLPGDTTYNYQFIVDAFSGGKKSDTLNKSGTTMTYSIGDVSITNCRLRFADAPANMVAIAMWKSLLIKPESIRPSESFYNVNKFALQDCKFVYDDKSSGTNTSWSVSDLTFDNVIFDSNNKRIEAEDIKIHNTGGAFGTRLKDNIVTNIKDTITTVIATDTTARTAWVFKVKNIDFDQLGFKYDRVGTVQRKSKLDPNHLSVNNIRLQAKELAYNSDSIIVNLNELKLKDKSGFAIQHGHGDLLYSDKMISLKNLLLQTNKSRIASEVVMEYPSISTITKHPEETKVSAVLENAYLNLTELGQLLPDLKQNPSFKPLLHKIINASGNITGSLARLQLNKLNITDNDGSKLYVTGLIQNATDPNKLVAILQDIDIQSGNHSIRSWLPVGTIPDSISIPSWLHLRGSGIYSKNNLKANLRLNSSLGDVTVYGTAINYTDKVNSRYDLNVPLLRMDVGRLIHDTTIGLINASLSAKGQGYNYKTLTANINLLLKEAVYKKYHYHDINSTATLNKGAYDLFLQSRDKNALATIKLKGRVDSLKSNIIGSVDINKVDLYATHWTTSPLAAKGNIILDVPSIQPRHLNGNILISQIEFADDSTIYALDTLRLIAADTNNQQQLNISGPFGFITADGNYDYTKAFTDISSMIQRHLEAEGKHQPFVAKETEIMDLNASLKWPRSLQHLAPGIDMKQPLILNGRLDSDSSLFKLGFFIPRIGFNEFKLDTLHGLINSNAEELVANIYLAGLAHPLFPLERTTMDIIAKNGVLNTDLNLYDKNQRQKYALGTLIKFLPDNGLSLSLKPDLILNRTSWTVSEGNAIVTSNGSLRSADLSISSKGQSLSVKTAPAKTSATPDLEVNINQFKLSTITSILEKDSLFAEGVATGKATISNYDKSALINAELTVDSIKMFNTSVGTLNINAKTPETGKYDIEAKLTGNDNDVTVKGSYAKELDFNVNLNKLNMASIEPFTLGNVRRMSGITTGQLTLKGNPSNPLIRGTLNFDSVGANIAAIGAYLKIPSDKIVFDEEGIKLNQFEITDSLNNKAVINGSILTKDYKNYRFQLALDANNFMAIGPKQSPDQLFYGPAFVDATAKIRGNQNLPRVDLILALKDSSNFTIVIPESKPGIADREGVIVFVDKSNDLDSSLLRVKDSLNLPKMGGMKGIALTARVEITPTSTLKVIVDQQNGDYLEVKGTANLDASMNPNSDLSLTGRYEINEGKYNMSLNNLIKRTFNIEKGSNITFQGGITNALVDITARYRIEAVAGDLVEDQLSGASDTRRTQFKQKVPVDVYLQVKNQLLKPEISFRLDMPERERNALNGVIYNRIKQINLVESELNKQVMGLLVLGSFIPENPIALLNERGNSGVEGAARKSASKLISQQLNNFAGSLIKGVDINFDLNSADDYSTGKLENRTDLNIGVSKSLFNNRVSVSVGSSLNLEGTAPSQQTSSLVGDVSIDYKITADGKYRIRAYRQNETDAIVEGQIVETGVSFIFVVDYNKIGELLRSKKKKAAAKTPKP